MSPALLEESKSRKKSDDADSRARQDRLLSKYGQRETEIEEQFETRLSRFDPKPQSSTRTMQLLNSDPTESLNRARNIGPPDAALALGSPRVKRVNPLPGAPRPTKPW